MIPVVLFAISAYAFARYLHPSPARKRGGFIPARALLWALRKRS
jgi:hypothetical protein